MIVTMTYTVKVTGRWLLPEGPEDREAAFRVSAQTAAAAEATARQLFYAEASLSKAVAETCAASALPA